MLLDRKAGSIRHHRIEDLKELLHKGDQLVVNDTKVLPAKLLGQRDGGGKCEVLLLRSLKNNDWLALAKPGKKLKPGSHIYFSPHLSAEIIETTPTGQKILRLHCSTNLETALQECGWMPLPPYIKREEKDSRDYHNYQTMFAKAPGAVAAPTASLHFTPELLKTLNAKGVDLQTVTLHVGLGTFQPVMATDIREHEMQTELYEISENTAAALNKPREGRRICVGTTTCRTLESAVDPQGVIHPKLEETQIFIYPGYAFKATEVLLTNFHLPKSTLLMLVSAFAGIEFIQEAYASALENKYRFFSYGDAMLIV